MEIKGPANIVTGNLAEISKLAQIPATTARVLAQLNWQSGQLLNALVVSQDADNLLLNVEGQPVVVKNRPEFNFLPGQKLTLQLQQLRPDPVMKLVAPPIRAASPEQAALNQALRTEIPRQTPLPPLLANIETVARKPQQHPPLPAPIRKAAWDIHQAFPDVRQASRPDSLQQALERTGPFLHHMLLQMSQGKPAQPENNLHSALLRLAGQLRQQLELLAPRPGSSPPPRADSGVRQPLPGGSTSSTAATGSPQTPVAPPRPETIPAGQNVRPQTPQSQPQTMATLQNIAAQENGLEELLRQVEGGLARLNVHQLHSAQAEQSGRPMWAMELPIRSDQGTDLFDLRIQQEEQQQGDQEYQRPWSVMLAFDLQGLGPVRVNITLTGQTVSAQFQMEQDATRTLFNNYLDHLHSRLRGAGLEVGKLDCETGISDDIRHATGSGILDEKV